MSTTKLLIALVTTCALLGSNPVAAGWHSEALLASDENVRWGMPVGAIAGESNAIVAWTTLGATGSNMVVRRWDGADWLAEEEIDAGDEEVDDPKVSMAPDGQAVVVWSQSDGSAVRVYANCWNGTAWSGATIIDGRYGGYYVELVMAPSGIAMAYWTHVDDISYEHTIYMSRWSGSEWSEPTAAPAESDVVHLAVNDAGEVALASEADSDPDDFIRVALWDGSAWTASETISRAPAVSAPAVGIHADGRATLVWAQGDATGAVYTSRWDGSSWSNPEALTEEGMVSTPAIAVDASGRAVTAWGLAGENSIEIHARVLNDGVWGIAKVLGTSEGLPDKRIMLRQSAGIPRVLMDAGGNALVYWLGSDGSKFGNYSSRWDGTRWSGAHRVGGGENDALNFSAAMDADGRAIGVWSQEAAYDVDVRAAFYTPGDESETGGAGSEGFALGLLLILVAMRASRREHRRR